MSLNVYSRPINKKAANFLDALSDQTDVSLYINDFIKILEPLIQEPFSETGLFKIKGVPYKILEALDYFHGHFRTQQGRVPQKTIKVYSDD